MNPSLALQGFRDASIEIHLFLRQNMRASVLVGGGGVWKLSWTPPVVCYNALMDWSKPNLEGREVRTNDKGYFEVFLPEHPHSKDGWMLVHRLVMEEWLQRFLKTEEVVHHVNEEKKDNRISNLWLTDKEEHAKIHRLGKSPSSKQRATVRRKQRKNTVRASRDEFGRFRKNIDNTDA